MEKGKERNMDTLRKPLQGIRNIMRFNSHFYIAALLLISLGIGISFLVPASYQRWVSFFLFIVVAPMIASLLVSWYVYDVFPLYQLAWIQKNDTTLNIVNIHSGLDESSSLIKQKFPNSNIIIMDFYNPEKHTEVSIKRARKYYPPQPGTINITTATIPLAPNSVDKIFLILSAHEIRQADERISFFEELKRVLHPEGSIYVMEHLRNFENFMAYTIGFLHFHSRQTWLTTFAGAGLVVAATQKQTPFITVFELKNNGITD